jgi:hypothetical protein
MCLRLFALVVFVSVASIFGQSTKPIPELNGDKIQVPLAKRLMDPVAQKPFTPVESEQVQGLKLALQLLKSATCAAAVGGPDHQNFVQGRLLSTQHFALYPKMVSAEQVGNSIQTIYAFANIAQRWVFLFPSFSSPQSVFTKLLAGGATRMDTLRSMEVAEGFRTGSLSIELLQALILLHEQEHLNDTAIDDSWCVSLSMLNTRRVAEKCAPEIIEPIPNPKLLVTSDHSRRPKNCLGCHAAMGISVKMPKLPTTAKKTTPNVAKAKAKKT